MKTGECKELFPTGSQQQEPLVTLYEGRGFIVGRDNMSIFIDPDGNPTKKHPVKWSDIPHEIGKILLNPDLSFFSSHSCSK